MQLILVGRGDTGLRRLLTYFAPGAAAITDGPALAAAGDPEPPRPLNATHGVLLILVDSTLGGEARRLVDRLLEARAGRRALLAKSDIDEEVEAWTAWLQMQGRRAAALDAELPEQDPQAFAAGFFEWFGVEAPCVYMGEAPSGSSPHAAPPRPVTPSQAMVRPATDIKTLLKTRLNERLLLWQHGVAAVAGVRRSPHFDADFYLAANPDVAASGVDPALHYLAVGAAERRAPGPGFSTNAWYARHPEAARAGLNPLLHKPERSRP